MNWLTQQGLLNASLKRTLSENGLDGCFSGDRSDGEESFVGGAGVRLKIFFRSTLNADFIEKKEREMSDALSGGEHLLFVSPRISQRLIDSHDAKGIHFFSTEGFSRIRLPGFTYIVHSPSASKAGRGGSAGSAFVGKASSLPRLFFREPERIWLQTELAKEAGLTKPYVSIIIRRMVEAGYVLQDGRGFRLQSPDLMLDDWSAVYRFDRYSWRQEFAMAFQQVRNGMDKLSSALTEKAIKYALMGQCGAYLRCPYMEPAKVTAYVPELLSDPIPGLHPVERDGNVILYVPPNPGFFIGENKVDGLSIVSDIQLYLDLKKMPGRSADQANYLRENILNWSR